MYVLILFYICIYKFQLKWKNDTFCTFMHTQGTQKYMLMYVLMYTHSFDLFNKKALTKSMDNLVQSSVQKQGHQMVIKKHI